MWVTNATQSSDIESLLRRPNLQRSNRSTSSESRHHQRLGRGDRISPSLGHPCPRCRVVNLHTTRSTLTIGYPPRVQRRQTRRGTTPGIPPILAITRKRRRIAEEPRHQKRTRQVHSGCSTQQNSSI